MVKLAPRGAGESRSRYPGDPPRLHDPRDVPHGSVQENWYYSKTLNHELRHFYVYTPPGYDARSAAGYPVLFLLHGAGNSETNWQSIGRANFIVDNLLAEKQVKPMLLVMPFGHAVPQNGPDQARNNSLFEQDLVTSIMPALESSYRVAKGARNHAIAGLSMGGMQALAIGIHNPDLFAWIGVQPDHGIGFRHALRGAAGGRGRAEQETCHALDRLRHGGQSVQRRESSRRNSHQTWGQHEFHPSEGGRHAGALARIPGAHGATLFR